MCRLVAYLGHNVLLEDVLVKPSNSIIKQSLHALETTIPTNGDGFGIGWYMPAISPEPGLFTSISPAWSNRNLLSLASKLLSPVFFGHVRAATLGGVTQYNCHPFVYKQWMLMHNGDIHDFISIKRHLRKLLDDDIYNWIQGETDSEHLFALFLQLAKGRNLKNITVVGEVLEETFAKIKKLIARYGKPGPSYFNICLTNGKQFIATRYCTDKRMIPETMHYAQGSRFVTKKGHYHMLKNHGERNCVLITSERLNDFDVEWHDVPVNHMFMLDSKLNIQLRAL